MPAPMRIRARLAGERATVRVLMSHEMESGQRRDAEGRAIPAWYIQDVTVSLNGRLVLAAQWGPAVSKNPFLQFGVRGARAGDRITIAWTDNHGATRTDETTVA
jgi:sulfur-oxidizing protein SoxZ